MAFNIYFERDPSVDPASSCPDPASTTFIKCIFWGSPLSIESVSNEGQYRKAFHVVIAGSNGYTSNKVAPLSGYNSTAYGLSAIQAPLDCNGQNTLIRTETYNSTTNEPSKCAVACDVHNTYWAARATNRTITPLCEFFNSYILSKNDIPYAQQCGLYSVAWPATYATNMGQYQGSDRIGVSWSFGYKRDSAKNTCLSPASA